MRKVRFSYRVLRTAGDFAKGRFFGQIFQEVYLCTDGLSFTKMDEIQISEMLRFFPDSGKIHGLGKYLPGGFHIVDLKIAYLSYV